MQFGSVCSGKSRTGRPAIDLLGQRFGRLLVVERVENDKRVVEKSPVLTSLSSKKNIPDKTMWLCRASGRNQRAVTAWRALV